jgi:hypothetical protein
MSGKLQKISDFVPCSVTKEREDDESNGATLCKQICCTGIVLPLMFIVDHCEYPHCQVTMRFDDWQQRSLHIKHHCDLKAAAGLILELKKRGLSLMRHFQTLFTRNGTLKSLEQTVVSYYRSNYSLESLRLPWTPKKEDWQPVKPFIEEFSLESRNINVGRGESALFARERGIRSARSVGYRRERKERGDSPERRISSLVHETSAIAP